MDCLHCVVARAVRDQVAEGKPREDAIKEAIGGIAQAFFDHLREAERRKIEPKKAAASFADLFDLAYRVIVEHDLERRPGYVDGPARPQ